MLEDEIIYDTIPEHFKKSKLYGVKLNGTGINFYSSSLKRDFIVNNEDDLQHLLETISYLMIDYIDLPHDFLRLFMRQDIKDMLKNMEENDLTRIFKWHTSIYDDGIVTLTCEIGNYSFLDILLRQCHKLSEYAIMCITENGHFEMFKSILKYHPREINLDKEIYSWPVKRIKDKMCQWVSKSGNFEFLQYVHESLKCPITNDCLTPCLENYNFDSLEYLVTKGCDHIEWFSISNITDVRALQFIHDHNLEKHTRVMDLCIGANHYEFLRYCLDHNFKPPSNYVEFSFESLTMLCEYELDISYSDHSAVTDNDFENLHFMELKQSLGFNMSGVCRKAVKLGLIEILNFALQHEKINNTMKLFQTAIKCNRRMIFNLLLEVFTEVDLVSLFDNCCRTMDSYYCIELLPRLDKENTKFITSVIMNDKLDVFLLMKDEFKSFNSHVGLAISENSLVSLKHFIENNYVFTPFDIKMLFLNLSKLDSLKLVFVLNRDILPQSSYTIKDNIVYFHILFDSDDSYDRTLIVNDEYTDEIYDEIKRSHEELYREIYNLIRESGYHFFYECNFTGCNDY